MKVAELLEARRRNWKELELLAGTLESRGQRKLNAPSAVRFASLYRSACADLALADAYHLPQHTVNYLHHLVGRAHNQLYRGGKLNPGGLFAQLVDVVPRRLCRDWSLRLAFVLFYGCFFACMIMAYLHRDAAEQISGPAFLEQLDVMYSQPVARKNNLGAGSGMMGFYVQHNTSIGLRVFVFGIFLGVGGLVETIQNACVLGGAFGYMASTANWPNFRDFVTAHGPFELNAIVVSAAAGMRLGFSLIETNGWSRKASLRRAAKESVPVVALAVILFGLAAFIEGFISPTSFAVGSWDYTREIKVAVASCSSAVLIFYLVVLGGRSGS
ncbi:MAG: stage II sporulation protein M [Planctomycetales bacterium]